MDTQQSVVTRRQLFALASAAAMSASAGTEEYPAAEPSHPQTSAHKQRKFQERLATQQRLLGLLQTRTSPVLEELVRECGYDFLMVDGEHGTFSEADFRATLARLDHVDILTLLRVPKRDPHLAERYLGMGADVIVAPQVSTVEDAQKMARASRARNGSLIVILETQDGVQNAHEILAVDGVDAGIIGPLDLSTDLGIRGQYSHPTYAAAFSRIERAAAACNKPLGTIPHGDNSLAALSERGHKLFILASDRALMRDALSTRVAQAKSAFESSARHSAGVWREGIR